MSFFLVAFYSFQGCSNTCSNHDHSEFITDQLKKILNKATENEIKCFDFGSINRELRPHLRTIKAR